MTPRQLSARLEDVVVLDVQYNLVGTPGTELYAAAHLPGAPHLDLDADLAGPPGAGGRHPLPDPAVAQAALRRCGVREDSAVVVYDQRTSLSAARAWWLLRYLGIEDVSVLDGGLAAWQAADLPVEAEAPEIASGDVTVHPGGLPVLDATAAAALAREGVLLDSRAPERYAGDVEPIDPVAGHIPGAVNAPLADYLDGDGTFRPVADLSRYFAARGATHDGPPVGTSCGSGVTAAHTALALHELGIEAAVYVGSWSEWVTDPSRPVVTGADPG